MYDHECKQKRSASGDLAVTTTIDARSPTQTLGSLRVAAFAHPQGCRAYLLSDPASGQALALDVHLDLVDAVAERVNAEGWTLPYVVDSHTHADHPSGAGALAGRFASTRIAHRDAHHRGVARHPADGESLHLGDVPVTVRHAPGHTPDHVVLVAEGALFSGDTLLLGTVARTDFLGGSAARLFDTLRSVVAPLPDSTRVFPGHDYQGRTSGTLGEERASNPWLAMTREEFVRNLEANPPPRPANMDDLLRLNRDGLEVPETVSAATAVERARSGGAVSIVDVRTDVEAESEHVPGSRRIPLDQVRDRADEVRATPAPRLLLCRTGSRAAMARRTLSELGIGGLSVVSGGIEAFRAAGGETVRGVQRMSLERQVRIAAGSLSLLGLALGFLAHPGFFGLSAFIGAGQVFAGLTDWCGMGLLIARMPWNRLSRGPSASAAPSACAASAPTAGRTPDSHPSGGCAAPAAPSGPSSPPS
jgi:glyoxylase-like metal-dependent hydrolase (beta-lactamase superfamily II)/rhodanese-related sulfurtransferase